MERRKGSERVHKERCLNVGKYKVSEGKVSYFLHLLLRVGWILPCKGVRSIPFIGMNLPGPICSHNIKSQREHNKSARGTAELTGKANFTNLPILSSMEASRVAETAIVTLSIL